ncbi:YceI family protein [Flammeovirgaceae bacterium SG7u.111]|nr:YceI family protein [Flammeovirgaceae bacterium SG7u.132]WPO35689.1 YceI family protein [Flammeovirgaceae bacterium SG7u.111]
MFKLSSKLIMMSLIWVITAQTLMAQDFTLAEESSAEIKGTSTLHEWTTTVPDVTGKLVVEKAFLKKSGPKNGDEIKSVEVSFKVKTMDGGRGSTMNNKIFNAFKEPEYPEVTFKSTAPIVTTQTIDKSTGKFKVKAVGDLSMAGTTKSVELELEGQKMENGDLHFLGSHTLKMTEFDIKPPSAMFGQIVCGDDVTINFDITAKQ